MTVLTASPDPSRSSSTRLIAPASNGAVAVSTSARTNAPRQLDQQRQLLEQVFVAADDFRLAPQHLLIGVDLDRRVADADQDGPAEVHQRPTPAPVP
jgi:hypothetical protein